MQATFGHVDHIGQLTRFIVFGSDKGHLAEFGRHEQAGDVAMTGAKLITMVRDDRWKAVFIHGAEDGQLFDLEQDPAEQNNLWGLQAHAETRQYLKDVMFNWRQDSLLETMDLHGDAR